MKIENSQIKTLTMTHDDKERESQLRLQNFYIQIHMTVIYETEFLKQLKNYKALEYFRDEILDNINRERRQLGYLA